MSDRAIRIEELGKRYHIGARQVSYATLRDKIAQVAVTPFRKAARLLSGHASGAAGLEEIIWALKDVSFEVRKGEVVGLIGRNGAGKTTLLKVLSRITEPTEGWAEIEGRVGSLLEVGTGFHPELTGRENIFLNGAILGMKKVDIEKKFDEIVAFAEVEKFIDTPVKHYSSGMYVRLAFAVSAHLEPEILLVDEVLAVGDAAFQKKCLGKMSDVSREGRTVLFVSHNMGAVRRLCTRALLLDEGRLRSDGQPDEIISLYLKSASGDAARQVFFKDDPNKQISILKVAVLANGKEDSEVLDVSDRIELEVTYRVRQAIKGTNIALALSREGVTIFRSWDIDNEPALFELRKAGDYKATITLPEGLFTPGQYSVYAAAGRPGVGLVNQHPDCLVFDLESIKRDLTHSSFSRDGMLMLPVEWKTETLS